MGGFGNQQNEETGEQTLFTSMSLVKMIASPGVTYFTEGGCRGVSETTTASENVSVVDLVSDTSSAGAVIRQAKSVRVEWGVTVEFYEQPGFQGQTQ